MNKPHTVCEYCRLPLLWFEGRLYSSQGSFMAVTCHVNGTHGEVTRNKSNRPQDSAMNQLAGLTPARLTQAFRNLNVATDGKDFSGAAQSVWRHIRYHAPDAECRDRYDLATALGRFDVYVPGMSYDETATEVMAHLGLARKMR